LAAQTLISDWQQLTCECASSRKGCETSCLLTKVLLFLASAKSPKPKEMYVMELSFGWILLFLSLHFSLSLGGSDIAEMKCPKLQILLNSSRPLFPLISSAK
jgi:hypothetical protein